MMKLAREEICHTPMHRCWCWYRLLARVHWALSLYVKCNYWKVECPKTNLGYTSPYSDNNMLTDASSGPWAARLIIVTCVNGLEFTLCNANPGKLTGSAKTASLNSLKARTTFTELCDCRSTPNMTAQHTSVMILWHLVTQFTLCMSGICQTNVTHQMTIQSSVRHVSWNNCRIVQIGTRFLTISRNDCNEFSYRNIVIASAVRYLASTFDLCRADKLIRLLGLCKKQWSRLCR
jgi:hypothetical protein